MKRLVLLMATAMSLWASPDFFGYFETEGSVLGVGSASYTYGFNKLRVDIEARPNDHILIGANLNVQKYWGKTTWNIYDFVPGYENLGTVWNIALPDTVLLDNVYMRVRFHVFDLTVGRQQISPGVGYAWNPTDLFNTKSLLDPSYEQTGVSLIRVDIPLANRASFNMILDPAADLDSSTVQVWLKGGFSQFDVSLTAGSEEWESLNAFSFAAGAVDRRHMFGANIVGEIFGFGTWVEYARFNIDYGLLTPSLSASSSIYLPPQVETYEEYVLGLDYTLENGLYVLTEYLHNGYGKQKKSQLGFMDYVYSLSGFSHSLMQDYSFVFVSHPTFDYVTLSAITFVNLDDGSGIFSPQLNWNAFQNTNLSLQGSFGWGAEDSEFGLQDWGLILNITSNF